MEVVERQRLTALFADDRHVEVEATWGIYQSPPTAYHSEAATLGTSYARAIQPRSTSGKPGSSPST